MRFANLLLLTAASVHGGILFEPNRGQSSPRVDYAVRLPRAVAGITASGLEIDRQDGSRSSLRLIGSNPSAPSAAALHAPGASHYARGADPSRWIWDVPHFAEVRYSNVYPGVDLIWHGAGAGELEFDFLLAPYADPSRIALRLSQAVRLRRPQAWQTVNGARVPVDAHFAVSRNSIVRLRLGPYDRSRTLTIDPIVVTASFLGGSDNESESKVIAGPGGEIYLAGVTASADFPAALPAGSPLNHPEILIAPSAYVTRVQDNGAAQDWSLFLGGNGVQSVLGLRQDALGDIYILGSTVSPNFPVTAGAYQTAISAFGQDLFLVKLDAQTGHIKASTFLGANSGSASLAVDSAGGVYVAGRVNDDNFKTTPGVYQPNPGGNAGPYGAHSFILRLNSTLTGLVYSTLFDAGTITTLQVDGNGNVILGGSLPGPSPYSSPALPAINPIPGVTQDKYPTREAFVAKLNATGTALLFASQLHGTNNFSTVSDIKIASDGSIHILGYAGPSGFPLVNPLISGTPPATSTDPAPFWISLPASGGAPIQSTVLYGAEYNTAPALAYPQSLRVAFQSSGQPCFLNVGTGNLQQSPGALVGIPSVFGGLSYGGTLVCVNDAGNALGVKTLLPAGAQFSEVAAAPDGSFVFTGAAQSNFATTPGALQTTFGGGVTHDQFYPYPLAYGDSCFLRMSLANPAPVIQSVVPDSLVQITSFSGPFNFDLYGSGFAYGASVTFNGQPVTSNFVDAGHISVTGVTYSSIQPGPNQISISLPAPGGGASQSVLTAINPTPFAPTISPASITQGAADTKIVIRATNLARNSTLYWNGQPLAAQYVADSPATGGHFELVLTAAQLASPFSATVAISNPAPGGGMSPTSYLP